jgi:hypothetical protein
VANIFTTVGEGYTADVFDGTISAAANHYVGWGTGAGTAAKADTTLFTEAAEARVITTRSQPTASQNRFVGTITSASGQTISNAGILTALTVGSLLLHSDFTGIALLTGDAIQFTFTLTWS